MAAQTSPVPDGMGNRICPLNDVDGDTRPDFALDDACGWVWLVSGKTGKCIARIEGDNAESRYNTITPLFGDVDGDGAWDLADWHGDAKQQFHLLLRSGKDLHVVRELKLPESSQPSAWLTFSAAGDWNADGVPDLAVAGSTKSRSSLLVLSGKDGAQLATCHAAPGGDHAAESLILGPAIISAPRVGRADRILGTNGEHKYVVLFRKEDLEHPTVVPTDMSDLELERAFAFVGDRDGDSIPDLVTATGKTLQDENLRQTLVGRALLLSGASGQRISEVQVAPVNMIDGVTGMRVADLDEDGTADYLVSYTGFVSGQALIYSGTTNKVIRTIDEREACCAEACRFGASSADIGDVDGDGVADYAIGSNGGVDGVFPGCVSVFSGKGGSKLYSLWKSDFFREKR